MNAEMGLTGKFSQDFRDSLNETIPALQGMGLGVSDIVEHTKEMVDNSGKFAFISTESQIKAAEIATAFGMSMKELAGSYKSFEDVGIGKSLTIELGGVSITDHSTSGIEPAEPIFEEVNLKAKSVRIVSDHTA